MKSGANILRKASAVVLSAAVLLAAPGLGAWEAVAQIVPIHIQAPVGTMGSMGAAGTRVGAPTFNAPVVAPGIGLPVLGVPGLAPTFTPDPRLSAPVPGGLPASAIPGVATPQANPFARFATPGAIPVEGRYTPPPGPGGAEAAAAPVTPAAQAAAANTGSLAPTPFEKAADGLPAELGESLHAVRGAPNKLGQHFSALRAAFGLRADSDLPAVNAAKGSLQPGSDSSFTGSVASFLYRPISAARTGLARLIGVGRSSSAPLAPPAPLTLKTSADGMALTIESPAAAANKVAAEEAPNPGAAAPAPEPAKPVAEKSWFGLGKTAMMFIGSLVVAQVGVEALGSAMPTLVQKTFGDFTAVAQLAIFSSIASIIGRQLGPMAVRRFGLKASYLGASALRLVSISILAGLLATGHMTLPLMMGFYSINGFLRDISLTAMESIPPALVGQDQARIEKFWTWEQTLLEIIGIAGPIATGAIVASFGFLPALVAFPVTMAASLGIVLLTLKLPKTEALDAAPAEGAPTAPKKGFWAKVFHGAKIVWGTPVLRTAFLAYTAVMTLNPFLYTMLGPAYGLALLGAENAQAATSVNGWLTGLYSLGGLLGGFMMMWEQKRTAKAKAARRAEHEAKNGKVSDEAWEAVAKPWENEVLRKSMLSWLAWAAVGLSAIATMAFPVPMLGALVALPSWLGWLGNLTLPALALIPFGIAQVVSVLKLRSFFQSQVPDAKQNMADAMGFFGSASLAVTTVGLLALKALFQGFTGFTPFVYIAAAMLPLAAYYVYLRWRLNRLSKPA
ncbi:MAG: hypothetical protein HY928_15235 [Elusimicrobia bacterium]|nr:hypothetical protein [Elusimicrobiota bacterium]